MLQRGFPNLNRVMLSGEALTVATDPKNPKGLVSFLLGVINEDRVPRRFKLRVLVHPDLVADAKSVIAPGCEVMVEGELSPSPGRTSAMQIFARGLQVRNSEGVIHTVKKGVAATESAPVKVAKIVETPKPVAPIAPIAPVVSVKPESQIQSKPVTRRPTRKRSTEPRRRKPESSTPRKSVETVTETSSVAVAPPAQAQKKPSVRPKRVPRPAPPKRTKPAVKPVTKPAPKKRKPEKKTDSPFELTQSESLFDPFLVDDSD